MPGDDGAPAGRSGGLRAGLNAEGGQCRVACRRRSVPGCMPKAVSAGLHAEGGRGLQSEVLRWSNIMFSTKG